MMRVGTRIQLPVNMVETEPPTRITGFHPKDDLVVVITMEQTMPDNWNLKKLLKPLVYSAIRK